MKARPDAPLANGLPHIAYVVLWYPLFTQPFIFREVEELAKILPVQVYALYGHNLRHCSSEMRNPRVKVINFGARSVMSVIWELLKEGCSHPVRTGRIFARSCLRRWPNLEILGENLWGFCVGVSLGRRFREDGIDMVYAPWPRGAATAAWVGADIASIPFGIAARGDNLNPADPDLADKLKAAATVRANNAADKKRIEDFGAREATGKTFLVYNSLTLPVTGNAARPRTDYGGPIRLLALGRFDVTKGFDVLLKACALLKQRGVPFSLTLAGGGGKVMGLGSLEDSLRDMRKRLDLEDQVDMPGLISHDELPQFFTVHDIFVAPCIIHSSGRRDGIPNTIIEAMAAGLPVISTDVNAIPEIVINNVTGILTPAGDDNALATAIASLASDAVKRRQLGQNGAEVASRLFDPASNAQILADMLQKAWRDSNPAWLPEQSHTPESAES